MIIQSMLDTDLYKLTMQMAIALFYDDVPVTYEFINRTGTTFPDGFDDLLRSEVNAMQSLALTNFELDFLRGACPYLSPAYLDFLAGYRYNSDEVIISQKNGELSVVISGPWYRTVLWEVPLLAIISELYYRFQGVAPKSDYIQKMSDKLDKIQESGIMVSEFGTRRRFSRTVQDAFISMSVLKRPVGNQGGIIGTSNVHLAHKYGLMPVGTMAHEWVMAHAAMFGYRMANKQMLDAWVDVYKGDLGIALPDTFTSDVFFRDFGMMPAKLFDGVRWDSGDWKEFTEKVIGHYNKLRIDPTTKSIIYSDALDIDKAIEIHDYCDGRIRDRYGIGTHLTNDVGHKPLNIVIKLSSCDGVPVVKLSDSPGKETGKMSARKLCVDTLNLEGSGW